MLQAVLLAVALSANASDSPTSAKTPVQRCFAAMDGAVYHGDPTDRTLMKANVVACTRGIAAIQRIRPTIAQGPEKLFLLGRILDRAATLSFMGLDDATTALREVRLANLYFRIAAGLSGQSEDYHAAALANTQLTRVQLQTLHAELAGAGLAAPAATVALRRHGAAHTAYHKL